MKSKTPLSKKSPGSLYLGIDIGSISINMVVMDSNMEVVEETYTWCQGKPFDKLLSLLEDLHKRYPESSIEKLGLTGTGGKLAAELIGGENVNEVVAQSTAVSRLHPEVRTIIEMGGEDAKLIFMEDVDGESSKLSDFELNTLCAAGTGSFLDQQAKRIGVSIENEFGQLALKSEDPPRIAGRCSVFAKSDMIHLQQIATPVHDIVAGLCFAVARNFLSTLGRGKKPEFPVCFQGGVAANPGMVRAFRELLKADDSMLVIPERHASMGAIGSIYNVVENSQNGKNPYRGPDGLKKYLTSERPKGKSFEPLKPAESTINKEIHVLGDDEVPAKVYLGLDIGSLSTNVVLIDDHDRVIARRYLPTASRPLEALRRGLSEIYDEVGSKVQVMAAGTTGSGRYLTGDFIGADLIRNEITAQATAAIAFDPKVDTIFEIGGQDSKYISIKDGVVVDFEMNKVCAAGTGSFLEEQAEKLGINIVQEFGNLALSAREPAGIGDRCTVFIESDLNSFQQKGTSRENLVGGLAYSIVNNYLLKVVRKKRVGDHILFQGGVTNNKAVVSAFEKVTGKKIHIPPHFDITGAIGAAMLARDHVKKNNLKTRFKGFDISKVEYKLDKFHCRECSNQCEIRRIRIEGEKKPLYYGGRCDKYEIEERKGHGQDIPDYFKERLEMLMEGYNPHHHSENGARVIGIPRGLMIYYQQFPFWRTFFENLGFRVVLSSETNNQMVNKALSMISAETCFPVEVIHGHIHELFEKGVDYVFTPFIMNARAESDNPTTNFNCPWIQTYPFMVKASLEQEYKDKMLVPALNFRHGNKVLEDGLYTEIGKKFNLSRQLVKKALAEALKAQDIFENKVKQKGKEVLANLPEDKECVVIMGRPYNTGDPMLNLAMAEKLINMDVLPIPMDFLELEKEKITGEYNKMYWPNGQRILSAARIIARNDKLNAIYMGNFRCGPDSFLSHFVHEEMGGKPYLELEIDEHSADAGMITRYEAFLDSLQGYRLSKTFNEEIRQKGVITPSPMKGRTLYFPYMNDSAYAISAVTRSFGIDSEVLPMQTQEDLDLGRKYTSSRECFPMICTTGSFLKKLFNSGESADKMSFFMPDHNGPCRFGQYNRFQRILFDKLGYRDTQIISPSNDASYEDISGGHGTRFRYNAWKGFVAVDLLRKLYQERKPYEQVEGSVKMVYDETLNEIVKCLENGAEGLADILAAGGKKFSEIPLLDIPRKPVVGIVGEIFMRDNAFCSGHLVQKLEKFGAETWIAPFAEWLTFSTIRYRRDSKWKNDYKGVLKSRIQEFSQKRSAHQLLEVVEQYIDVEKDIPVPMILNSCGEYVHRHYDGDPAINLGTSVILAQRGISGIANILPFTCMPGTLVTAVSNQFKKDHKQLPYVSIAYDGQEDTSIDLRLQAFIHQAYQYRDQHIPEVSCRREKIATV